MWGLWCESFSTHSIQSILSFASRISTSRNDSFLLSITSKSNISRFCIPAWNSVFTFCRTSIYPFIVEKFAVAVLKADNIFMLRTVWIVADSLVIISKFISFPRSIFFSLFEYFFVTDIFQKSRLKTWYKIFFSWIFCTLSTIALSLNTDKGENLKNNLNFLKIIYNIHIFYYFSIYLWQFQW